MNTRKQLIYGIALGVVVLTIIYAGVQLADPYRGLTLTEDTQITDEERAYVESRITVSESALAIQRENEDIDLDLLLNLAWDYTIVGNLVAARETYEEYFTHNAINYTAWANYGHILKRMGDIEGAEDAYLQALQIYPTEANYRNYVTLLQKYNEEGERDADIFRALEAGVERVGQTSWFMVTLAEYYVDQGQCQQAFDHYEAAIDLAPDIPAIVDDYNQAKETCQS